MGGRPQYMDLEQQIRTFPEMVVPSLHNVSTQDTIIQDLLPQRFFLAVKGPPTPLVAMVTRSGTVEVPSDLDIQSHSDRGSSH